MAKSKYRRAASLHSTIAFTNAAISQIKRKSEYGRLFARYPDATEANPLFARQDAMVDRRMQEPMVWLPTWWTLYPKPLARSLRLLNVIMRNMWLDIAPDIYEFPYARAADCIIEGHAAMLEHLAREKHIDLVKVWVVFIDEEKDLGCFELAMDVAAMQGHLDILKTLHKAGSSAISKSAINWAASNGHFDVVKWLYENRKEGCTSDAIDNAAVGGHFRIVEYLVVVCNEEFTMDAVRWTKSFKVANLLVKHMSLNDMAEAIDIADKQGWSSICIDVIRSEFNQVLDTHIQDDQKRQLLLRNTLESPQKIAPKSQKKRRKLPKRSPAAERHPWRSDRVPESVPEPEPVVDSEKVVSNPALALVPEAVQQDPARLEKHFQIAQDLFGNSDNDDMSTF